MDNEDFDEVLKAVRQFIREVVVPAEEQIEADDKVPDSIREQAKEMGLFGFAIPEEYGGLGLDMKQEVLLNMELGWGTPAFRSMFGTNNGIAGQVLVKAGTEEQKQEWLPKLAAGTTASFALTEPEAGSDPSSLKTKAVKDGDEYVINGGKCFITNAAMADVLMVFARVGDIPGGKGIAVFLVETDRPGVTIAPHDKKMGQRGAWTSDINFDDVRIPASHLIGGDESVGFPTAMRSLQQGRLTLAAYMTGTSRRLVHEMVKYASEREQGGQVIADYQLVQGLIADAQTDLYVSEATVLKGAQDWDSEKDRRMAPSVAKYFASEAVGRIADRAVQVHGGYGYMHGYVVERLYRDVRLYRIYEGTSQIQQVVIAKQALAPYRQG
ncbi:acyl-CoA dehydrogenase family protein [Blastococcus sp. Marseille-P5729]|uniref:acyl-CoA dehydrogenase family protein n=1 Tax=Blastococcus sp. Marseille-P5729 TaxID=2086582 RepID=UPI000D0EE199|nr:acyl-CoA dehydrogenase family protein [Blastococcus sp. Marseille-P5729]